MNQANELKLTDFEALKKSLEGERSALMKFHQFSEEDGMVREKEDALFLLGFIEKIQSNLINLFIELPSLKSLFEDEYTSFEDFIQRETILDLIFLDECLFPEKELFFFGQDGGISEKILDLHLSTIDKWIDKSKSRHLETQALVRQEDILKVKSNQLACQCHGCLGEFRTKLRESALKAGLEKIDNAVEEIRKELDRGETWLNDVYRSLSKDIEKLIYSLRHKLRRSTLNRLENQLKSKIRETFSYPSSLAVERAKNLTIFFKTYLHEEGIADDLLTDEDYGRFFSTLKTNIWRGQNYLQKEFEKTLNSIMVLKKKDVSSKILNEYLGEFWTHSLAREIKRKIIYHMGPTNSGKTYHAIQALCQAERGCYLAPLRLLAGELYDTMNSKGVKTTLLTGEEVIETPEATHFSSTIEMARLNDDFDCCVIDEIQMITDPQRGWAWTRALVNIMATEIHICGDPSVLDLVQQIVDLCGDELEVRNYERMTELKIEENPVTLNQLEKSDALIVFSRRNALRYKRDLEKLGFKVSIVYGRLSPEVRREQARKFDEGETDIIVSTDAIAMGMNLPIRRIVFSTLSKFINNQEFVITRSEIKQIAGRAGRFKRFPVGYVNCLRRVEDGMDLLQDALYTELSQKEKCMVGPDLDIFSRVNKALNDHGLTNLRLSEFLRLFNTMKFVKPFFCVELNEMIELAETVEDADREGNLSSSEIFGFACAPVNLGLIDHVQYYIYILNNYVANHSINFERIQSKSNEIDYLETSIKCVELFQWLSRHFNGKNFSFDEQELLDNKNEAVEKLNQLLSKKIVPSCSSCGVKLPEDFSFPICEKCFKERRGSRRGAGRPGKKGSSHRSASRGPRKAGGKAGGPRPKRSLKRKRRK